MDFVSSVGHFLGVAPPNQRLEAIVDSAAGLRSLFIVIGLKPQPYVGLNEERKMSLVEFNCPECQNPLRIEVEDPPPARSPNLTQALIWFSVASCVLLLWSIVATAITSGRGTELRRVKQEIILVEQEADAQLAEAVRGSKRILDQATELRKQADGIILRDQEKLHEIFGSLQRFQPGNNQVGRQYLDHFEVSRGRIKTFLVNRTAYRIKPDLEIRFINRYGFLTRSFSKSSLFDMNPNETRVDDDAISFSYGDPVYYTVVFNK